MNLKRTLSAVALALALISSSVSASAQTPDTGRATADTGRNDGLPDGVVVDNGHVKISIEGHTIFREHKHQLPSTARTVATLIGQRRTNPGGDSRCVFAFEEHFGADELAADELFVTREIGYDAQTCSMTIEQAVVDQEWIAADDREPMVFTGEDEARSATLTLGTSSSRSRYYEARYEDPPNLDVTRIRVKLSWSYNGSCVTSSWNNIVSWYKATATGWAKDSGWVSASELCSRAKTTANDYKFHNSVFCSAILAWLPWPLGLAWALLQPTTYNLYDPMEIIGEEDGSYWASGAASKWGGCDSFLSYESQFGSF